MSGFTVITTMKNEGAFLLEWVAHHKALGFDNILICTNDCADHTRKMALRLQMLGLAQHHATRHWPATSIQRSALKQATRYDIVRQAEWVWVCDADEFLCIKAGDGTARALVALSGSEAEVISVPWRIFGSNGRLDYDEGAITRQFPLGQAARPPLASGHVYAKSLFRGDLPYARIGIHAPMPREGAAAFRRVEPGGQPMARNRNTMIAKADFRIAQVNHYALRSAGSFLVKRDRGRVNHVGQDMGLDYWNRFNLQQEHCDAIRRYDELAGVWLGQLMADAELAFLHRKSVAWHRARIAALKAQPEHAALWQAIGAGFAA